MRTPIVINAIVSAIFFPCHLNAAAPAKIRIGIAGDSYIGSLTTKANAAPVAAIFNSVFINPVVTIDGVGGVTLGCTYLDTCAHGEGIDNSYVSTDFFAAGPYDVCVMNLGTNDISQGALEYDNGPPGSGTDFDGLHGWGVNAYENSLRIRVDEWVVSGKCPIILINTIGGGNFARTDGSRWVDPTILINTELYSGAIGTIVGENPGVVFMGADIYAVHDDPAQVALYYDSVGGEFTDTGVLWFTSKMVQAIQAVPEPSTMFLQGTALLVLMGLTARRRS